MSDRAVHLAPRFTLPLDATADVIAILGRRGRGKTTTATVLVEELHAAGHRFCVADPVGVWWGLKSSRDGKGPGIPVVVMGGDRGDVPLEDTAGKVIADFVADPTGPSVVLDFRAFRKGQMTRFMTDFLEQLYHRNRHPLHLVLDEADQFAPQRFTGEVARLVGAAEDVCKMGRARGLHPIAITQRPAALNKNVLTQAGILIVHGLTGPQDIKAVEAWIHERADEEHRTEVLSSLPGLGRGQAWVWAPELEILKQVEVRDRKTFDSSATPKGESLKGPRVLAEVDLAKLKERIASTIEKVKAEDPRELRKTIAELRAELKRKDAVLAEVDVRTKRIDEKLAKVKPPRVVEKAVLKDAQIKRLEAAIRAAAKIADETLRSASDRVAAAAADLKVALGKATAPATPAPPMGRGIAALIPDRPPSRPAPVVARPPRSPRVNEEPSGVTPAQQRIVDALAWLESVGLRSANRTQLALLADQSPTSSSYANNLGALRSAGLVDYGAGSTVFLSEKGRSAANETDEQPTSESIQRSIISRLSPAKARILQALIDAYPAGLTRPELAARSEQSATSSSFANNLGSLRSLGVIDYRVGEVVALPVLFVERA
jgi:hypothetical protein